MSERPYDSDTPTEAQIARSKIQKQYGIGAAAAGLKQAFDKIPANAWPYYKGQFANTANTVVICSNRSQPYAHTRIDFDDGSSLIEVFKAHQSAAGGIRVQGGSNEIHAARYQPQGRGNAR